MMPTFFMNVASPSDLWLFLASNGALTAGRVDAEQALFPYQTVDKIYDSAGLTGPSTIVRLPGTPEDILWEPFAGHTPQVHTVTRNLYKSIEGDCVWFEEINHALQLAFRYGWSAAEEHGLLRQCELENLGSKPVTLNLLDSLRNLLPPGINSRLQNGSSCLADAYKTAEILSGSTLAVYSLSAGIVDRAIPLESLRASAVWSHGLPEAKLLLSDAQFAAFCEGVTPQTEARSRGLRCTYAVTTTLTLPAHGLQRWMMVADTGLTQADVAARALALAGGTLPAQVLAATESSTSRLRAIVAAADGLQTGGDETAAAHHFANVLFNVMRGGIFADSHRVPGADFATFVATHHHGTARRHAALLAGLPESLTRHELLARLAGTGDADLARLAAEYLPLTFSRRHGDPSRPWNRFRIHVRDEQGRRVLAHEGNWRDIFQNWESLCLGHPDFYEAVVAKFLSASTADGYNPYRLSNAGLDWEAPEPEEPWASIGYWGDHQVVYLLKLLEWSSRYHPGRLASTLRDPLYSYANVPYRIAPYAELRRDPRATITFDHALHRTLLERVHQFGTDARLLTGADGTVVHVNLTEKLLILALTRLTNFIPGGGIWMNTQRPEWNDANNALVGYGVSMVTLCYFRRLLNHWLSVLLAEAGTAPLPVSAAVVYLARQVAAALSAHRPLLDSAALADGPRRALVDALATAGSDYRQTVYRQGPGVATNLDPAELSGLLDTALAYIDHTIRTSRRADGLYHAYNLLEFTEQPAGLRVHHLAPMLEGQVAVLSAGVLSPAEVHDLLAALRASPLYRADQHSYLLYPDRERPGFLERNSVPAAAVAACPLLQRLLAAGDRRLILCDAAGQHRFHPDLVNGDALEERLQRLGRENNLAQAVQAHRTQVHEIYEQVFHHRAFTGRSGSMFGYEGLGCIYWHMVAKLLLAVQENYQSARDDGSPSTATLATHYYDVRAGLGFNKTPSVYGAFPTDPYSHTPGHSGAQQPGMTGQVKEEILTRFGELGVEVFGGRLSFRPSLLQAREFSSEPLGFAYFTAEGAEKSLALPAGALAFTYCAVPVIYRLTPGAAGLRVHESGGAVSELAGHTLDARLSTAVFDRAGGVTLIEVILGAAYRPL